MILGCDLSHWNGVTDYAKMKQAGIQFAFIKVTQGANIIDGRAALHAHGLKTQGIPYGYYHFVTDSATQPQVDNLSRFIDANGFPPLGVFIDIETKLTTIAWAALLQAFKDTYGADKIGVYCGWNSWNILGNPPDPGVTKWVANYKYHNAVYWKPSNYRETIEKCKTLNPVTPNNWAGWQYWQFTGEWLPVPSLGYPPRRLTLIFIPVTWPTFTRRHPPRWMSALPN